MENQGSAEARGLARPTVGMAMLRLLIFLVIGVMLMLLCFVVFDPEAQYQISLTMFAVQVVLWAIVIIAYRIAVRVLERRRASELALDASVWLVLTGTLFGMVLFSSVYLILWMADVARFVGVRGFDGVLAAFAISVAAAIGEEIFFRGILYRIVENTFGTLSALIVSSAFFGLVHSTNPGATLVTAAMIAIEAGLLFGLAYSVKRSLWFPIGIHFGWNFTQSGIFGAPLSGVPLPGVLDFSLAGPEILTGGAFGPEASIVGFAVCVSAVVVLGRSTVRSAQWRTLRTVTARAQA